jgi:biotin carboxylase
MSAPTAVLTGPYNRVGIVVVQSLARAGWKIVVASEITPSGCGGLSGVIAEVKTPPPFAKQLEYVQTIDYAAEHYKAEVILPLQEEIFVLSFQKNRLSQPGKLLAPEFEILMRMHDKANLPTLARSANVPTPATWLIDSTDNIDEILSEISFPIVIKPRYGFNGRGIKIATKLDDLEETFKYIQSQRPKTYLAQTAVTGAGIGVGCLFSGGEIVAQASHIRLREVSLRGGASTARKTFTHGAIEDSATRLLKIAGLQSGVAMVEFKYNAETDSYFLLDINPRYWGGLPTAIASGVDFPRLQVEQMYHPPTISPIRPARAVETRWLLGEIRANLELLLAGRLSEVRKAFKKPRQTVPIYEEVGENYNVLGRHIITYLRRAFLHKALADDYSARLRFFAAQGQDIANGLL